MNPAHLEWMAKTVSQGYYLFCPQGSHLAIYDDQQVYFEGLIQFIQDVDALKDSNSNQHMHSTGEMS
jgi:proline iminopeptidase